MSVLFAWICDGCSDRLISDTINLLPHNWMPDTSPDGRVWHYCSTCVDKRNARNE